jgi:uncharacterized protein (DUF4415 family)
MKKKSSVSSVQEKRPVRRGRHIPDSEIDFSDIPELTDEQLARGRRVGRPMSEQVKELISIRIDPMLLFKLKKLAEKKKKPYQKMIHEMLELAVKKAA